MDVPVDHWISAVASVGVEGGSGYSCLTLLLPRFGFATCSVVLLALAAGCGWMGQKGRWLPDVQRALVGQLHVLLVRVCRACVIVPWCWGAKGTRERWRWQRSGALELLRASGIARCHECSETNSAYPPECAFVPLTRASKCMERAWPTRQAQQAGCYLHPDP